jgi:hypothetical protein
MITRELLRAIRLPIEEAVNAVLKEHGMAAKMGNVTFDAASFKFTMSCALLGDASNAQEALDRKEWDRVCTSYGFKKEDFGLEIVATSTDLKGATMVLCGISSKAKKSPFLVRVKSGTAPSRIGKTYKVTPSVLFNWLGLPVPDRLKWLEQSWLRGRAY